MTQKQTKIPAEQNREPRNNIYIFHQQIFNKSAKERQWERGSVINNCCWENWICTCKGMKLEPSLTPYTKINSKWIKDLRVRPETIKFLGKHIGENLLDIGFDNYIFGYDTKGLSKAVKINGTKVIVFFTIIYSPK